MQNQSQTSSNNSEVEMKSLQDELQLVLKKEREAQVFVWALQ